MSQFKFAPLDLALHVVCACRSEMVFRSEALRANRPIYCPCSRLEFIPDKEIDAYQAKICKMAADNTREDR